MAKDQESGENSVQIITSPDKQRTIRHPFSQTGEGLHYGQEVKVIVFPGEENQGIVFHLGQGEKKLCIPSHYQYLYSSSRNTALANNGIILSTIEHFLASCWGAGIDNLTVIVEGNEMPAGDGSCTIWTGHFRVSGIQEQDAFRSLYKVQREFWVEANNQYLFVFPSENFEATYFLDYFNGPSFAQCSHFVEGEENFNQIASARTFAFQCEVQNILRAGLGLGVRNAALIIDDKGQSGQLFRMAGEPSYHKIVDLIGDLMLLRHRVIGHFIGLRSGHALNHQMIKLIAKKARLFDENRSEGGY